jgi:hypothetical protein
VIPLQLERNGVAVVERSGDHGLSSNGGLTDAMGWPGTFDKLRVRRSGDRHVGAGYRQPDPCRSTTLADNELAEILAGDPALVDRT